jgi:hypothetical protein
MQSGRVRQVQSVRRESVSSDDHRLSVPVGLPGRDSSYLGRYLIMVWIIESPLHDWHRHRGCEQHQQERLSKRDLDLATRRNIVDKLHPATVEPQAAKGTS